MALSGRDPNAPEDIAMDITYNGRFHDFNQIYAAGDGLLPSVDPLADFPLIPRGSRPTAGSERPVFSNSDSHYHLDRLYDIANRNLVDRNGDDVFFGGDLTKPIPLMWTQDNELPLEFDTRTPWTEPPTATRAFFANRQTVFGGFDDHWNQYVGESLPQSRRRWCSTNRTRRRILRQAALPAIPFWNAPVVNAPPPAAPFSLMPTATRFSKSKRSRKVPPR
ncbi:MAG: hypothetical protein Ct9H300mP1_27220 [Planctomycetaceae bacterium]|nr:MAG: hypothetical protein Ct9H300mP1_27220 [Planctomycetaceae bacterium]